MLITKCILKEREMSDGIRISVMSRHTLSDGITPDKRIKDFDAHIPVLGPSPKLIGDYYKRGLGWKDFTERYILEIRQGAKKDLVKYLAELSLKQNITIMCIEDDYHFCHRSILAKECKKYVPNLIIKHL